MHTQFVSCPKIANSKVLKFLDIIDFKKISDLVTPKIRSMSGRAGFVADSMLKANFLGNYYGLSDRVLEDELKGRVTFRVIGGMYKDEDFPDYKTLCNFGNDLEDADMLEVMFDEINALLDVQNIKIQKGNIVIVDATLVHSAARPLKETE